MALPERTARNYFTGATEAFLWAASTAGLILSVMSALNICTSACSEVSQYTIFGLDFGWFGVIYFGLLLGALGLHHLFAWAGRVVVLLICAATGAELRFIWLQKYAIGKWCPLCLAIAATIYLMASIVLLSKGNMVRSRREDMKELVKYVAVLTMAFFLGLSGAILGAQKEANAAELNFFLGKPDSSTVVYFVSDWFCPACRRTEPAIAEMYPKIAAVAKVGFVDIPVHPETSNFTPYNLQFLIYEKGKYMQLRKALAELAKKTKTPSSDDVQKAIAPYGVKLRSMNYADVATGMNWNENIFQAFEIRATPTVVVSNTKTGKHLNFVGEKEISFQAISGAIAEVGK